MDSGRKMVCLGSEASRGKAQTEKSGGAIRSLRPKDASEKNLQTKRLGFREQDLGYRVQGVRYRLWGLLGYKA